MAITKIVFYADNDTNSDAEDVNVAMINENADLYGFIGDGPYSTSGTAWVTQQKKSFNTEILRLKQIWSRGNHDEDESESKQTQEDMEAWFPEAAENHITDTWLMSRRVGNVYVIAMDSQDMDVEFKRDQFNWVAAELVKAKALRASGQVDWIAVLFHKPFFTLKSSHSPYTAVRFLYKELFRDAQVDFVLHGHNHNTQLWFPMIPNQSEANGEGTQLFSYLPDGKTFDFSKDHGQAYIITGHAGHEWNGISDTGAGVANVQHYRDSGEFGYTLIEFDGKKAHVLSKDINNVVSFEYNVSREGGVTPPPPVCPPGQHLENGVCVPDTVPTECPVGQCKDKVTGLCRLIGADEMLDVDGTCKPKTEPPICPDGQVWDPILKKCVPIIIPPPGDKDTLEYDISVKDNKTGAIVKAFTRDSSVEKTNDYAILIDQRPNGPAGKLLDTVHVDVSTVVTPPPAPKKLIPTSIVATSEDAGKTAVMVNDGDFESRWSADGIGESITFTFDKKYVVTSVKLTGFHYHKTYTFEINGKQFTCPAGRTANTLIEYDVRDLNIDSDKLTITGKGNSETTYNSYREIEVWGVESGVTPPPPPTCPPGQHIDPITGLCVPDTIPPPPPPPPPGGPVLNVVFPTSIEALKTGVIDASTSVADTVTTQYTSSTNINFKPDPTAKWKWTFTPPAIPAGVAGATTFSLSFKSEARRAGFVSQKSFSISVTSNNPPPPPPPPGDLDAFGMKILAGKPTGKKVAMEEGADHENGKRYNVNHFYHNYIMQGYYKIGSGQQKINHKGDGPNHGGCTSKPNCLWYEFDINLATGKFEIQYEMPHPTNHSVSDSVCEHVETVGSIQAGQWIGWACAYYWGPDGKRHMKAFVDKNPFDAAGKPLNNWVEGIWAIEKGQIVTGITHPRDIQAMLDHEAGAESEIRMHGATSGDTEMKNAWVIELVPQGVPS